MFYRRWTRCSAGRAKGFDMIGASSAEHRAPPAHLQMYLFINWELVEADRINMSW